MKTRDADTNARYFTTLLVTHDEIKSWVEACEFLELVWLIENVPDSSRVKMRAFLDERDKNKYLAERFTAYVQTIL